MEHLQTIRYWIIAGSCLLGAAATLFCIGAWFYTSPRWRTLFSTLNRQFRSLPPFGKLVAIVFLATFIVKGSTKTNNAPPPSPPPGGMDFDGGIQMQPGEEGFPGPRLTTNQYRAGFALVRVATNAAPWFTVPSNAVLHAPWTRYGVAEDTFWLPATNWAFILGTNAVVGLHVSSSGTLSFGWPKGSPRARGLPDGSELDFLAPLQTSIGIAPPGGRFWHAPTLSNSLLLTWQDVHANRDTNYPVSIQSELFANGDFTFRYDFSSLKPQASSLPTTNFVVGAQHNGGGETYAFGDTNRLVNGLELRWRAFGLLDPDIDDHDGDGLSTYDEVMIYDSDPRLPDTDLDGLPDAIEEQLGTLLRERDTDGDGIPDGSDPNPLVPDAADGDGDGLPDAWELYRFGSTNATDNAAADSDDDGFGNLTEMLIGSDPAFAVCAVSASEGAHAFTWTDLPDATGYTLSVASNGMQVWSCATNACSLTLTNAFPTGDCTLTVVSSGGVTSHTAQIAFATPAAPNLTVWRIADPFALVPPAADGVILERTFDIARSGGWQQFFVSSSPDGAAAWSLEHLRLDWSDSAGASGSATASPSGDSLRLSLSTNSPQVLTIRLVATGTNVLARSPGTLHLLGWSPAIDLAAGEGAALAATTNGPVLAAVTDLGGGTTAASFTVDRGGRPCNTLPAPEELAQQANPFAADSGAEFTGSHGASGELTGGALLAGDPGIFPLPGAGGGNAPTSGGGAAQAGSPAAPSGAVALIAPIVTQLHDHRGCPYDGSDGYPFDSACLREAWYNVTTVSTGVGVSLGGGELNARATVVINDVEGCDYIWQDDTDTTADVEVSLDGASVWQTCVEREPDSMDSRHCTWGRDTECGGCGGCADGDCDDTEDDDLGSVRFRVPLGFTGQKQLAGFLWFVMESPQAVTPALFQADVAPGVVLEHGNPGGTLSRAVCHAPGGRDIAIAAIDNGMRLSIRDAGATGEEFSWTITKTGEDVTFMRQDNASPANTLRHTTYSYSSGVWTRADHLAGAEESLEATDYPPDDEQDPWEKSEWLTFTAAGRLLSSSLKNRTLIGKGEAAAWRDTLHAEWDGQVDDWRYTTMSYWQDNLNPLVNGLPMVRTSPDGSWEYRQYDARGRETLRAEPLDGYVTPYSISGYLSSVAISNGAVCLWPFNAIVTTTSYEPLAGDSAAWQDSRRPRETRRYAVKNGVFTLTAREWNVFSRGSSDGWPTLARTAVRAATAGAAYGDTANARSMSVSVIGDADEVPVLMRGRPLREEHPNGTLRTWSYLYGDNDSDGTNDVLTVTARTGTTTHANGLAYVSTYTTEQVDAVFGRLLERKTYLYTGGTGDPELEGESRQYDAKGRHIRSDFSDGTAAENIWSCCRLEASQGRDGALREYLAIPGEDHWSAVAETSLASLPGADGRYPVAESFTDALGRETNSVRAVWHYTSRDPAYAPLQTRTEYPYGTDYYRVVTDPLGAQTVSRSTYSLFQFNYRLTDETIAAGVTNRSIRIPGAAPVEERFWDGKWTRETRAASFGSDGCRTETSVTESSDYPAVTNSVTRYDFLGRVACVQTPAFGGGWLAVSNFYDGASSRLLRVTRTGHPGTLYQYDALGNPTATALDVDGDGQIDYAGDDRISATATRYESINGDWWRVTTQSVWHEAGVDACLTTGVSRVRLTGFGGWDDVYCGSLTARSETLDAHGNVTRASTYADTAMPSTWQVLETPDSIQPALTYSVAGHPVLMMTATAVTNSLAYDGFARQTAWTDGRGNTTVTHYNALGQADWTENAAGNRTAYGYDALGRRTSETDALTNTVHTAYDSRGNVVSAWGATYPVEYGYDTQGRKVSMKTFRDEEGAGDETRWLYDNATGLLTNKVYADGKGPSYTYTPGGKPATRTWARGVETTYSYDASGSLTNIAYSDYTPPVSFTLDRQGLLKSITDATGSRDFTFNDMMQLVAETNDFAALNRTYDELGRSGGYQVAVGEAGAQVVAYVYSDRGRFSSLSSAIPTASNLWNYTYLANSESISGWSNGIVTTVKCFETNRNLFTQVRHAAVGTLISQFDYENDELGRRTRRLDAGSAVATNLFAYDARSQLTYAAMKDNEFAWGFDAIGNRVSDISNSVTHGYSVNALNQYRQITNGGVRNLAYDLDGNLTNDSVYAYVWDGENRLVGVNGGGVVAVHKYDNMSRRVEKTVNAVTNRFIYDGWNLIAETSTAGVTNFYVWGADLSGSLQGAGGIGGLLVVIRNGQTYYPVADANGNITDYVDANGAIVAHREFDAFGNTLVATGPMVDDFNFWFSSKYLDHETGLYYYGHRYYNPEFGRWSNRDPIHELGFAIIAQNSEIRDQGFLWLNAAESDSDLLYFDEAVTRPKESISYNFVLNTPVNGWDAIGLDITLETGNLARGDLNDKYHQAVCVDEWYDGPASRGCTEDNKWKCCHMTRVCFSFGRTGSQLPQFSSMWLGWRSSVVGAILRGEIYSHSAVPRASIDGIYTTTMVQDRNWLQYMKRRRLGTQDGYSLARHNCRKFSQWEYRDAPLHW